MSVGAIEPQFYAALLKGLGLDAATHAAPARPVAVAGDHGAIRRGLRDQDARRVVRHLRRHRRLRRAVLGLGEAHEHPHNRARELLITDRHGKLEPAPAPRLSRTPGDGARPLPRSASTPGRCWRSTGCRPTTSSASRGPARSADRRRRPRCAVLARCRPRSRSAAKRLPPERPARRRPGASRSRSVQRLAGGRNTMWRLFPVVVALSTLSAATAQAAVLCQSKGSGIVRVRSACKKKELPLDLSQFGAVGPAGPPGACRLPRTGRTPGRTGDRGSLGRRVGAHRRVRHGPSRHTEFVQHHSGERCCGVGEPGRALFPGSPVQGARDGGHGDRRLRRCTGQPDDRHGSPNAIAGGCRTSAAATSTTPPS